MSREHTGELCVYILGVAAAKTKGMIVGFHAGNMNYI